MRKSHCTSRAFFLFCFCCYARSMQATFGDPTNENVCLVFYLVIYQCQFSYWITLDTILLLTSFVSGHPLLSSSEAALSCSLLAKSRSLISWASLGTRTLASRSHSWSVTCFCLPLPTFGGTLDTSGYLSTGKFPE